MSTPANILTIPITERPSRDGATRGPSPGPGLFALHDFIRPGEEPLYAELDESLRHDFAPVGILEHTLIDEVRRAMWRLRRCGLVEENLLAHAPTSGPIPDPMRSEDPARTQLNVDRARSQTHRLLHKCTAELRRLQTSRKYRDETFAAGADISDHGIIDWRSVVKGVDEKFMADYRRTKFRGMAEIDAVLSYTVASPPRSGSFCKTA
jgi:hypothetical protein